MDSFHPQYHWVKGDQCSNIKMKAKDCHESPLKKKQANTKTGCFCTPKPVFFVRWAGRFSGNSEKRFPTFQTPVGGPVWIFAAVRLQGYQKPFGHTLDGEAPTSTIDIAIRFATPRKFNIAPENRPSQKENSLPTIIFQGLG